MLTRILRREPCAASTVRVRNDGENPRLTSAIPPLRTKTRLEIMQALLSLKCWCAEFSRTELQIGKWHAYARYGVLAERNGKVHTSHQAAGIYPGVRRMGVSRGGLRLIQRHSQV